MYYLACVDKDGLIVESIHFVHEKDRNEKSAIINLKMLSEFVTHISWSKMKELGFKIVKLKREH